MLYISSWALQGLGLLVVIGGSIYGLMQNTRYDNSGLIIVFASVTSGIFLMGVGSAFGALDNITQNVERTTESNHRSMLANERSAEALERLAASRKREPPPVQQSSVVKPLT